MLIGILPFMLGVILIFIARYHSPNSPAKYFAFIWGIQIILIYALFYNSFYWKFYGLLYIFFSVLGFSVGSLIGEMLVISQTKVSSHIYLYNIKKAVRIQVILISLSLVFTLKHLYNQGFSVSALLSFVDLLEMNHSISVSRYTVAATSDLIDQVLLVAVYTSPLYGGYNYIFFSKKLKRWSVMSILPSILIAFTQGVKLALIAAVILWFTGFIVASFSRNNHFSLFKTKYLVKFFSIGLLLFTILIVSMVLRTGRFNGEIIEEILFKFSNYAFGHLPAFDNWFAGNDMYHYSMGGRFFYGITNTFGILEREQGVYQDLINYGQSEYCYTNVYTVFRIIVDDFGPLLGVLFMVILGFISGIFYTLLKCHQFFYVSQTMIVIFLFFVFMGFITTVFAYASYIATYILFYFLLRFSYKCIK